MPGQLRLEIAAPVAEIIIDAPARRNAFNIEMWAALPGLVAEAEASPEARVIILHGGETGHFAAGADISEFETIYADRESAAKSRDTISDALDRLATCRKPVIAAIEGACVGGGVSLALACDIQIAAEDARFGVTPAKLGLVYPPGDTRRLLAAVGPAQARDILFTGAIFDAGRALRIGLVAELCAPGTALQTAKEKAARVAAVSQYSVREMKEIIAALGSPEGLDETEGRERFVQAATGPDFREGYLSFIQKRKPDFPTV